MGVKEHSNYIKLKILRELNRLATKNTNVATDKKVRMENLFMNNGKGYFWNNV